MHMCIDILSENKVLIYNWLAVIVKKIAVCWCSYKKLVNSFTNKLVIVLIIENRYMYNVAKV